MKSVIHFKITSNPRSIELDLHWWQAVVLITLEAAVIYFIGRAVGA